MTTSQVDITFPADNVRTSKSTMRTQFETIKDELDILFARIGEAGKMAFDNALSSGQVNTRIRLAKLSQPNYARDNLAFNWQSL